MFQKTPKIFSFVLTGLLFATTAVVAEVDIVEVPQKELKILKKEASKFAENEVIITFKKGKGPSSFFTRMLKKYLGKGEYTTHKYSSIGAMHIKSNDIGTKALIKILRKSIFSKYIESVAPNNIMNLTSTSDSYYSKLWAVENSAQEVNGKKGKKDADMDVVEAWKKTKGDKNIVVAVLDTGVDYRHSDLSDNMWNGNKYHGYDFAADDEGNNDNNPMPDEPYDENGHYHGTHVAGTVGAVGDNDEGISGVAQHVSIMAIKVFRPNGYGYTNDILEGLDFVSKKVDEGVNIVAINASYGGGGGSQDDATNKAIKKLGEQGVVFCAAAGNSGEDIDKNPSYPASYDAENIITVAASDQDDKLAGFSNYGKKSVDVAAPGTNILSTYPDDQYAYLDGTSMATPNVVGSIALLASAYPNSTVAERKAMIIDNVETKSAFNNKVSSNGRVNINDALGNGGEPQPEPNTAPDAKNDSASTKYETAVTVDVLANDSDADGDTLSIKSFKTPAHGSIKKKNGKLVYTPENGFSGKDTFEYTITDGTDEATAKVTVTVAEEEKKNTAPKAKNDSASTKYETAVTLDVLANDSDADGDTLSIKSFKTPAHGSVKKKNGKLVYTPENGFSGKDTFEYTITDGTDEATAKVVIEVEEKEEDDNKGGFFGGFRGWSFW